MAESYLPLSLIISFGVSFVSVLILKHLAVRVNLLDTPDDRKIHEGHVPLVGGISIFLAIATSFLFFPGSELEITAYLIAAIVVVLIGLLDDRSEIKVRYRLLGQLLASLIVTLGSGITIHTLGIYGAGNSFDLGVMALPFTLFSIMVAINAFNFVDGIDGLSGLLFMIAMLAMVFLCVLKSGSGIANYIVPLIFFVAVIPYMVFNLGLLGSHNRVFLGDAGSMLLGLTVAWLIIRYTQGSVQVFAPVTGLWIIALPLMDMLAIVVRRLKYGKAPFRPDRRHLHHLFIDRGMSDRHVLIVIGLMATIFASIGVISEIYGISHQIMLLAFVLIFFAYLYLVDHFENQELAKNSFSQQK